MLLPTLNTIALLLLAGTPVPLTLNEGERVLFLGNGFVENEQAHAYLETALQRRFPRLTLTFRSMGWSGDTVRASARTAGFQVPQGLARLEKEAQAQKPTLLFLAYGMNESFDGPQGLPAFLQDYDKLLKALTPLKARLVIVSPTYHEDLDRPFPDPTEHNQHLRQYTLALKAFAEQRKLLFVDLYHPLEAAKKADAKLRLTTNGILLTAAGSLLAAAAAEQQLGFAPHRWEVTLDKDGKLSDSSGTKIGAIAAKEAILRFEASDTMLPLHEQQKLRVTGLAPGQYTLKIDGKEAVRGTAAMWQQGLSYQAPEDDTLKLRQAIVLRNELFYRRWRPYNDHSRHWGFIGGDFKLYDDEIAKQEQRIAALRAARPHTYTLIRTGP